jgi:hypothetical protein
MSDYLKLAIAMITLIASLFMLLDHDVPVHVTINVENHNYPVYNKFQDGGRYYVVDFNKTLTEVDEKMYSEAFLS